MDEVKVRPAEKKDAARIALIHVGTWLYAYRGKMPDALLDSLSVEQRTERVDADFMNKGVGSALEEKGINFLREQGYKKATLWVLSSNEKTIKWYESRGWKVEGKTKTDKRDEFQLHDTRYIKDLLTL